MRIPNHRALDAIQSVVRVKADTYGVTRPTTVRDGYGDDSETRQSAGDVSLWVFNPNESEQGTQYGDRVDGTLAALALPDTDIQRNDIIDHFGDEYEVVDMVETPEDKQSVLMIIGFDRVTNP